MQVKTSEVGDAAVASSKWNSSILLLQGLQCRPKGERDTFSHYKKKCHFLPSQAGKGDQPAIPRMLSWSDFHGDRGLAQLLYLKPQPAKVTHSELYPCRVHLLAQSMQWLSASSCSPKLLIPGERISRRQHH